MSLSDCRSSIGRDRANGPFSVAKRSLQRHGWEEVKWRGVRGLDSPDPCGLSSTAGDLRRKRSSTKNEKPETLRPQP